MKISVLGPGDEIALAEFLLHHADSSMFLRSNMRNAGLTYTDRPFHGEYWAAWSDHDTLAGVLAHYWNNNILLQLPEAQPREALVKHFRQNVKRPIAGVLGPVEHADFVIEALNLPGTSFALNVNEDLFRLDLDRIKPATKATNSGIDLVHVTEIDRAVLTQWLIDYEKEASGKSDDMSLRLAVDLRVDRMGAQTDLWALLFQCNPVCMGGFNARLHDSVQVGSVWTPPEYRNKGFARTLVSKILKQASSDGVKSAVLFTHNPGAARAYEAIGFERAGSYKVALLESPYSIQQSK